MDGISNQQVIYLPASGKVAFKRGSLVFSNGGGIVDGIIRIGQGFRGYTHVGVALGTGKMIAAVALHGVTLQDDFQQLKALEARPYPGDVEEFISRVQSFIGDPYDYLALLLAIGIPVGGHGPPKSFTCSSLVAYCMGVQSFRGTAPEQIWQALK